MLLPGQRFPGETEAIAQTIAWGAEYGYGNLIDHLRQAWKRMLMEKWGFDEVSAEIGAGIRRPPPRPASHRA
jgi:hypothetical protein